MKKKYTLLAIVELLLFFVSLIILVLLYLLFGDNSIIVDIIKFLSLIMIFNLGLAGSSVSKLKMIDVLNKLNKNNNESVQIFNDYFILTNNYFITDYYFFSLKPIVWSYNDIVLIYVIKNFDVHPFYLYIYNKDGSRIWIHITYDNDYEITDKTIKYCLEKNPNILVGNNEKNRKLMMERYNIKVRKRY